MDHKNSALMVLLLISCLKKEDTDLVAAIAIVLPAFHMSFSVDMHHHIILLLEYNQYHTLLNGVYTTYPRVYIFGLIGV